MKIYIVSDIEGSCNFTSHEEGASGTVLYEYFRRQMALESASACKGAIKFGAEVLVHDAHLTARNIDPTLLPREAKLMRCSGGDPYAMLSGIQNKEYDAVMMTGFHAGAGSAGSAVSHTFNQKTNSIFVNDLRLSEFLFNAYSASYLGIPVPFISGDSEICSFARQIIPSITTVEAVTGIGAGSISRHPEVVCEEIEAKVYEALCGDIKSCIAPLPGKFTVTINFKKHQDADFNSYYTGMTRISDNSLQYTHTDWYEVLRMVHFVLDK